MDYGLYIHIPFCIKKCAYCDFASAAVADEVKAKYFDALMREICTYKGLNTDSIFIGGGTPSCVDARYIADLFECINKNVHIAKNAEITLEANPGTLTKEKLGIYKSVGINRISLGAQSMQDDELTVLGRIHTAHDTFDAVHMIQSVGFENYNLDLMLAIPHQSIESLDDTLKKAVSLTPSHISAYSLIVEEGTPFYNLAQDGKLALPDEDTERNLCDYAYNFLESHGYNRYEISNFSKPGFESRHNLKYWQCLPYIGLGAAAHSFDGDRRFYNTADTSEYIRLINDGKSAKIGEDILCENDKIIEYIIMVLRLSRGIIFEDFYEKFGFKFEEKYAKTIQKHTKNGFFDMNNDRICFTNRGFSVSNAILAEFV